MGSLTAFRVLRSLGGKSNSREEADQITPELSSIRATLASNASSRTGFTNTVL